MPDPSGYAALSFDVEAGDGEAWSDALLAAGALSVDAADPRAGSCGERAIFAEPAEGDPQWWPVSRLTALFDRDADLAAIMRSTAATIGRDPPAYETFAVAEQDWVRATQAQFQPIRVADDLWVVPTWCEPPDRRAMNLVLDPGLAFGTGAHPTTRLCLLWLRAHVAQRTSVLDYGCGSGILAIAAAKLGANRVVGTDIDPQALRAGAHNARVNDADVAFVPVDALSDSTYDVVVANILANPLRLLAPALAARVASGGRIALAGILVTQAERVIASYGAWFDMTIWQSADGWALIAGRRRTDARP